MQAIKRAVYGDPALGFNVILPWLLALAFVAVGARNFEEGMSLDGPLYATIARNIAQSGEWFRLQSWIPEYPEFSQHPHLGFWLYALIFKVLPPQDWSARIPGHLFYIAFLLMLFSYVRVTVGQRFAVLTVLILWIWPRFSNPFSNVALDPPFLFWGSASVFLFDLALRRQRLGKAGLAGMCLAFAVMTKGTAAVGFLPAWATLMAIGILRNRASAKQCGIAVLAGVLTLGVYYGLVRGFGAPDFFARHVANLNGLGQRLWHIRNLFRPDYWIHLTRVTHFLAPLALVGIVRALASRDERAWVPSMLLFGFLGLYVPANLSGYHYWLPVLPWVAWLVVFSVFPLLSFFSARALVVGSSMAAIVGLFLVQYVPFVAHGAEPSPQELMARKLVARHALKRLALEGQPSMLTARFAWYGGVAIQKHIPPGDPFPVASRDLGILSIEGKADGRRIADLREQGWCPADQVSESVFWIACSAQGGVY